MGLIAAFGILIVLAVWLMWLEQRIERVTRKDDLPQSATPCGHDPGIEAELEKVRKAGGFYEYWRQGLNAEFRRQRGLRVQWHEKNDGLG